MFKVWQKKFIHSFMALKFRWMLTLPMHVKSLDVVLKNEQRAHL